jgi:hypothetical protein
MLATVAQRCKGDNSKYFAGKPNQKKNKQLQMQVFQ